MLHTHTHPQCNLPLQFQERRSILERFRRLVRDPGTPGKTTWFRFGCFFGTAHVVHASETKVYILCVDIYILFAYIKNDESIHFYEGKPTTTVTVRWHDPIYVDGYDMHTSYIYMCIIIENPVCHMLLWRKFYLGMYESLGWTGFRIQMVLLMEEIRLTS